MFEWLRYRKWLKESLDEIVMELLPFAIQAGESSYIDFKQDFYLVREFQKNKSESEKYVKENVKKMLEKYSTAFANTKGGFLIVGVAESHKKFKVCGVNFKNMRRQRLIKFINDEITLIKAKGIFVEMSLVSINNKQLFVFKFRRGLNYPYKAASGKFLIRVNDHVFSKDSI